MIVGVSYPTIIKDDKMANYDIYGIYMTKMSLNYLRKIYINKSKINLLALYSAKRIKNLTR
jgi:hypothetical protein